jgi:hypothetical protein
LVEQRLKDVMIAPIDQDDLCIARRNARAAAIPPKPPPMITTRFRFAGAATERDNGSRE